LPSVRTLAPVVACLVALFLPSHIDASSFPDVPRTHWAYDAVQKNIAAGFLPDGGPDARFAGERTISRYQAALVVSGLLRTFDQSQERTDPVEQSGLRQRQDSPAHSFRGRSGPCPDVGLGRRSVAAVGTSQRSERSATGLRQCW